MDGPLVAIAVLLASFVLSAQADQVAFWQSWCRTPFKVWVGFVVVLAAAVIGAAAYAGLDASNFPMEDGWKRGILIGLLAAGATRVDLGQVDGQLNAGQAKNLTALVMRRITTSLDRNASDRVRSWAVQLCVDELVLHAWAAGDPSTFASRLPDLNSAAALLTSPNSTEAAKGRGLLSSYVADAYVKEHVSRPRVDA